MRLENEEKEVKVLHKSLSILETVANFKNPEALGEITKMVKLHPATVRRILSTLKENDWIAQNNDGKYSMKDSVLCMADVASHHNILKEITFPIMQELSSSESQAMNLTVRNYEKCYILQQSRSGRIIDYVPPIGTELPIYASSGGKVLLSEISNIELQDILQMTEFKQLTKYTITKKSDFMNELEKVRKQGYAMDAHESMELGSCIAIPIRNDKNKIIAALSFSGFIGNLEERDITYYLKLLRQASKTITQKLHCN